MGEPRNRSFETIGAHPGLARYWEVETRTLEEMVPHGAPDTDSETFEYGWGDWTLDLTSSQLATYNGYHPHPSAFEGFESYWLNNHASQFDLDPYASAEGEPFESGWGVTVGFATDLESIEAATYDAIFEAYEDFFEGWADAYVETFPPAWLFTALFDVTIPQPEEDFEGEWELALMASI